MLKLLLTVFHSINTRDEPAHRYPNSGWTRFRRGQDKLEAQFKPEIDVCLFFCLKFIHSSLKKQSAAQ